MRFAITGSTGLIGSELTRSLRAAGHEVTRVTRSYSDLPHGERAVIWHPAEGGMLAPLVPLFKLGLGPTIGNGKQVWPWIAGADITPALLHVLERPEMS